MKVLLVKPTIGKRMGIGREVGPPLGLAYLGSMLEENGHKPTIADLNIVRKRTGENREKWFEQLEKMLSRFKPDLVGITCNTFERFEVFEIADFVKQKTQLPVVVGGIHATFCAKEILANIPSIDIITRGEGEVTLLEICEKLESGKPLKKTRGITYRDDEGRIVESPLRPLIEDLDILPFPARYLLAVKEYPIRMAASAGLDRYKVTNIISSRGCPFKCGFCSTTLMWGSKIRYRSPKNLVDEMEETLEDFGFLDGFTFSDDNLTVDRERTIEICRMIRDRGLDIVWDCYAHVNTISEDLVENMASVGCKLITFGVESGSQRMLKIMGKNTNLDKIKKAVKICRRYDILPKCNFMFGYPGETEEDVKRTFKFIKQNLQPNEVTIIDHVWLYPGTKIFKDLRESNYFGGEFDWFRKVLPSHTGVPIYVPEDNDQRLKTLKAFRIKHRFGYALRHPFKALMYMANPANLMKEVSWLRRKGV